MRSSSPGGTRRAPGTRRINAGTTPANLSPCSTAVVLQHVDRNRADERVEDVGDQPEQHLMYSSAFANSTGVPPECSPRPNSATRRDFPIPGSPPITTIPPVPRTALSHAAARTFCSRCRPAKGTTSTIRSEPGRGTDPRANVVV